MMVLSALLAGACGSEPPAKPAVPEPPPPPPTVVFVVLDTVRADHLSLCGYERPTSPELEALAAGGTWTCGAYVPGSWTLPSHASLFTGVEPAAHHAHAITSGVKDYSGVSSRSRALDEALPTLAEEMAEQGYRSVAVSANPVVSEKLGLMRGFEVARVAEKWGSYFDLGFGRALDGVLTELPRDDKPLFLFLNLAEAHQPWKNIPSALGWLPARKKVHWGKKTAEDPWRRYVEGRMDDEEAAELRARTTDLYDYGVWRADRTLGRVREALEGGGWCDDGCRWVVTSDHGEYLGEHQLLDHGHYVHEPNARVPLVVVDPAGPVELPSPVSALVAHELVQTGALPAPLPRVTSSAWPHVRRCARTDGKAYCAPAAAIWSGDEKLWWDGEQSWRVDLTVDPGELAPEPLGDHPLAAELAALVGEVEADARDEGAVDEDVVEALRSLGYLD